MYSAKKTVLIIQPLKKQGQVWQAVLMSQGISVIWESSGLDLSQILGQMSASGSSLPDLMLIEIEGLNTSHYAFCRWCRENYPDLKIILTSARQKEISPPERHWAISQGAQDLLPAFQKDTLLTGVTTGVNRVLEVLEWRAIQQESLMQGLLSLNNLQGTNKSKSDLATESSDPLSFFSSNSSEYSNTSELSLGMATPQSSLPHSDKAPALGNSVISMSAASDQSFQSVSDLQNGNGQYQTTPPPAQTPDGQKSEKNPSKPPNKKKYRGVSY